MSGMNFTSKDVIEIIQASKDSNVKSIHIKGLILEFDTNFHPNKHLSNAVHKDVPVLDDEGQPPDPTHFNIEPQVNDDQLILSEMADLLSIEDPATFEELHLKMMNNQGQS